MKTRSLWSLLLTVAPLRFPQETVAVAKLLPDFAKYTGLRPDFGRMEPTLSDPAVFQQYGMVVGLPDVRQVNALETLNLRGERSITCKGEFDRHPSKGALPAGAPPECEKLRQQPDALERAAELDAQYGREPDLKAMPRYCVPMSFKAVYDAAVKLQRALPFNIGFLAAPGDEASVIEVASAYENATHHRRAPAGFGELKGAHVS